MRHVLLTAVWASALASLLGCERVEVVEPSRFVGAAGADPYYAARELLAGMGLDTRDVWLNDDAVASVTDGVVVVYLNDDPLDRAAASGKIVDLCMTGRYVVVGPPRNITASLSDPILAEFNLQMGEPLPQEFTIDVSEHETHVEVVTGDRRVRGVKTVGSQEPHIGLWSLMEFPDRAFVVFFHCDGGGLLAAVSDTSFLRNDHLNKAGNAAAFWLLVTAWVNPAGWAEPTAVWFVTGSSHRSSVVGFLWTRSRPLFISLLALALLGLAASAQSLGPRIPAPEAVERRLGEHIAAVGRFSWRWGYEQAILDALRRRVRARRDLPWERLDAVAERAGVTPAAVQAAMADADLDTSFASPLNVRRRRSRRDRRNFLNHVRTLQRILQSETRWR